MLEFTQEQYDKIVSHSFAALPNEACGLISGKQQEGSGGAADVTVVANVYTLTNIDESPEHFSMSPEDQFSVISDIRKNNHTLIGNFHSHPETPSRPSEEDIRLAYNPNFKYLILSLASGEPVLKSFVIKDGSYTEEDIRITGIREERIPV